MFFLLAEAIIAEHRIHNRPPKGGPLLEVSNSRDSGVLGMTGLGIKFIVQDDGGAAAKMFDRRGFWTIGVGILRLHTWECNNLPEKVGPQHTAEIIMAMKNRCHGFR